MASSKIFGSEKIWRRAALFACLVIAAVVFGGPDPNARVRSALAIHDFGHVVGFGVVTLLFAFSLNAWSHTGLQRQVGTICLAAGAAVALGAAVELAQAATGLYGDPWDVVRDGAGALFVALILIAPQSAISGGARAVLVGIGIIVLAAFIYPLYAALDDEARARRQFPVLASFETRAELSRFGFIKKKNPEIVVMADNEGRPMQAMQLHLPPGKYSGFSLRHFPGNWQGMKALELLIINPELTPFEMTVRIDDAKYDSKLDIDDRYNRSFPLSPGLNRIEIPLSDVAAAPHGRRFDLGHVQLLLVYAVHLKQPRSIIVGPITLVH